MLVPQKPGHSSFSFIVCSQFEGCLQLAEQSVELRKEKEALGLLQQKRIKLNEKLRLKKALQSSLIENMKGAPEV